MVLIKRVAVVFIFSTPTGFLGLETVMNLEEFSISVNCFTSCCSSLNNTCSVILFHINTLPDSVETIYLEGEINQTLVRLTNFKLLTR